MAVFVTVSPDASASDILSELKLPRVRGLVVLNGGTEHLAGHVRELLLVALRDGLVRVALEDGLTLVTGGTDAGIFHLLGQALPESGSPAPIIGVAPSPLVTGRGRDGKEAIRLEPHHTHFVLVETDHWGGETPLLLRLTKELAREAPSVAVLASGGSVAREEMLGHVRAGRSVVVLAGSGRLADELLRVRAGTQDDGGLEMIAREGEIEVFNLEWRPALLRLIVRERLRKESGDVAGGLVG